MFVFVVVSSTCVAQSRVVENATMDRSSRLVAISQTLSDVVPIVIAHRGASGYLPEHTTEAAAFAHALGADYIEQDVVLTKDGVAVVMHDVTLNSITNVADLYPQRAVDGKYFVFDFTLEEIRQLSVTERDKKGRFPQNTGRFRIATLEEHIQLIQGLNESRKRNAGLYVEVKKPAMHRERGLDSSVEILRILRKYGYENAEDRVFLQCFEEPEVLRIRTELGCRLPLIQLLSSTPTKQHIAEIAKVADGIGVRIEAVVAGAGEDEPNITEVVEAAHQNALMVHVWTFRTDSLPQYSQSADQLLDWLVKRGRVDGIFTDQPDAVLNWRQIANRMGRLKGPFHLLRNGESGK